MADEEKMIKNYMGAVVSGILGRVVTDLNNDKPESFNAHAKEFGGELEKIRKLIDPNSDRKLSDDEILAMISDPKRVDEIMKGLDKEQQEAFADGISGIRAGLGAACATLPSATIDQALNAAEGDINAGLTDLREHADKKTAGSTFNAFLSVTDNEALSPQGQQNINTLATNLADGLPLGVDLPDAAKSCKAVGATENPALGYLSPDSVFNVGAPQKSSEHGK